MRAPAPAPLLTHEDAESLLAVRPATGGLELAITRPGLKVHYRLVAPREELSDFAERLLQAIESRRRVADVPGPSDGRMALGAVLAPGDGGETLMLLLARSGGGGEELEAEYVRFASRRQMADFAEALLGLRATP